MLRLKLLKALLRQLKRISISASGCSASKNCSEKTCKYSYDKERVLIVHAPEVIDTGDGQVNQKKIPLW